MFQAAMSNSTLSKEASLPSFNSSILQNTNILTSSQQQPPPPKKVKKKRSLPGNPDPDADVIALSPKSLLATNRFICEICNKGFQRDQNLQLHRRGHNLPWKLKQRNSKDVVKKKVYVCPEPSCVHHHPSRALGDLTGIKKHFCRKHGEKKFKCEKCSKIYAVQSDWKAHSKTCGTREYRCDCGTLFSRKDSFITHRAFCDALAEESARLSTNPFTKSILRPPPPPSQPPFPNLSTTSQNPNNSPLFPFSSAPSISLSLPPNWTQNPNHNPLVQIKTENPLFSPPPLFFQPPPPSLPKGLGTPTSPFTLAASPPISAHFLSATALLQKAAAMGAVASTTTRTLPPQQTHQNQDEDQVLLTAGFDHGLGTSSFRPITTDEVVLGPSVAMAGAHDHHQQQQQQQNQSDDYNTILGLASLATWQKNNEGFTRDFLGLTAGDDYGGGRRSFAGDDEVVVGDMLKFTGGLPYEVTAGYDRDNSSSSLLLKPQLLLHHHHHQEVEGFGGFVAAEPPAAAASEFKWG